MSELSLFPPDMIRSAVISECGGYRYELRRTWRLGQRKLCFIMLNPSVADASIDDPTVKRCMGFGRDLGYDGIIVVNLFAFRATDPKMLTIVNDPIGPENDRYIDDVVASSEIVIAAWGAFPNSYRKRHPFLRNRVDAIVERIGRLSMHVLGVTNAGSPQHPLYLPAWRTPVRWMP